MTDDFLFNEWRYRTLLGVRSEKARFVKCNRGTTGENDLYYGRFVCRVGVVGLKPAEFDIIRIRQWTVDHRARSQKVDSMAVFRERPYVQFNFLEDFGMAAAAGPRRNSKV